MQELRRFAARRKAQVTTMKKSFWIETIAIGTALACALGLLIATLAAAAVAVAAQSEPAQKTDVASVKRRAYEGMITCSGCGAKHSAALGQTAPDCARICVHGGASFALVDGDRLYRLDGDVNLLKKVAGQRAHITGVARGNTLKVLSVAATG